MAGLELPEPPAEERERSETLLALLVEEIEARGGALSFERYMELVLYAPELGYYASPNPHQGAAGDYVTAPELSPVFGRCVARQVRQVLDCLEGGDILEVGAGNGTLALEVLSGLRDLGHEAARYLILENNPALRARQRALLEAAGFGEVRWLDALPEAGFRGIVLANELLDAFPVRRFRLEDGAVNELFVIRENGSLAWRSAAPECPSLTERVEALAGSLPAPLPCGYTSELAPAQWRWVTELLRRLERGVVLAFDYGYPRHEYYHPQRVDGTLCCYYRHRMHADPLILPGLQDISAHVDFSAVAEAAIAGGGRLAGFATQAAFLLSTGVAELGADELGEPLSLEASARLKRLLLPGEMGELVKAIGFTRGVEEPLLGFSFRDQRARLGVALD